RNTHGTWAVSFTCTDHLVTGLAISAMSTAWNASLWSRWVGAWPVMQMMGMESAHAVYRPVIMLVPAGPDVPMQTPTPPVTRARASAAWVPPSSCRTAMWRIFSDLLSAW